MLRLLSRLASAAVFVGLCVFPVVVSAQGAWEIDSFHSDIQVEQDGGVDITETINVTFYTEKHGIFRDIPVKYRNTLNQHISLGLEVLGVTDETGEPIDYEVSREGAYQRIKIGDPFTTITGPHTYKIQYRADRALRYFDDHDELYWNVTGNAWEVSIDNASATVYLPFAPDNQTKVICYTGETGSTAQDCLGEIRSNEAWFTANDYLTIAVSWPKGLVAEPTFSKRVLWFVEDNTGIFWPIFALIGGYYVWSRRGRDPKGRGIVRQYEAPDKISPAELGYLVRQSFKTDDISAEIVALAEAGFLKIAEVKKDGWLKDKVEYELIRVGSAIPAVKHQRVLLDALFADAIDGRMAVKDLPTDFYKEVEKVKNAVWDAVEKRGYFDKKPESVWGAWVFAAIAVGFVLFAMAAAVQMRLDMVLGGIAAEVILIGFALLMPKRTEAGVAAYQYALGFKQYIAAAETERVQWQEKQNLFFDVLPYAMVFGIADKWAKAFEGKLQQPDWYAGSNAAAFSATRFTSSMNSFSAATLSHASPPSSNSSGFSGGSSGGGGGGGGGGSW